MGIEAINDHVSLRLPENYVYQRGTGEEGNRYGNVLFVQPGEETPSLTLKIAMKDEEISEKKRNWGGTHHLMLEVNAKGLPFIPANIKFLAVAAASERNQHSILLVAFQAFTDQEGPRAAAQLLAVHMNALLPNVIIDGVSGPVDPISGEDLLRIGGLIPTAGGEDANKSSLEWMARQVEESENPELLMKLSLNYYGGVDFEKDVQKAAELMEKAAQLGHPVAQFNTAIKYARGDGVPRDFAKAVAWMEKARNNGDPDASKHILAMKDGSELERRAGEGDVQAQARFAALLAQYPSDENAEEARKLAENAVNSGCAEGYRTLGQIYEQGLAVQKDLKKAAEAYENGAKRGDAACQSSFGRCLLQGFGVKRNVAESIPWLLKAAEQGDLLAAVNLSVMTSKGIQPCPTEKLIEYLLKAEKQDPSDARVADHLAIQYLNLPQPDYDKALQWYERAAELGSENGKEMANLFRYRRKLIDEGKLAESCGPEMLFRYLQRHDLVDEAFGRKSDNRNGGDEPDRPNTKPVKNDRVQAPKKSTPQNRKPEPAKDSQHASNKPGQEEAKEEKEPQRPNLDQVAANVRREKEKLEKEYQERAAEIEKKEKEPAERLKELQSNKKALGFFAFKEKGELQKKIDQLEGELSSLNAERKALSKDYESKIAPFALRLNLLYASPGDSFVFGRDPNPGGKPIKWNAAEKKGNQLRLVAANTMGLVRTCDIAESWLKRTFSEEAFRPEERLLLVETKGTVAYLPGKDDIEKTGTGFVAAPTEAFYNSGIEQHADKMIQSGVFFDAQYPSYDKKTIVRMDRKDAQTFLLKDGRDDTIAKDGRIEKIDDARKAGVRPMIIIDLGRLDKTVEYLSAERERKIEAAKKEVEKDPQIILSKFHGDYLVDPRDLADELGVPVTWLKPILDRLCRNGHLIRTDDKTRVYYSLS